MLGPHRAQAQRWRFEPGAYAGWGVVLCAVLYQFGQAGYDTFELYSTAIETYLVAMGEL